MRLFREKQLARVKMVFTKQADPQMDPAVIPAAQATDGNDSWTGRKKMLENPSKKCPAWNDTPTSTYINYMILYDIIWYYMIPHVQKSIITYSVYG